MGATAEQIHAIRKHLRQALHWIEALKRTVDKLLNGDEDPGLDERYGPWHYLEQQIRFTKEDYKAALKLWDDEAEMQLEIAAVHLPTLGYLTHSTPTAHGLALSAVQMVYASLPIVPERSERYLTQLAEILTEYVSPIDFESLRSRMDEEFRSAVSHLTGTSPTEWSRPDSPKIWAKKFGVDPVTFRRKHQRGEIKILKDSNRRVRVAVEDLKKFGIDPT